MIRPEATGYGNVYFLCNMLATKGIDIKCKTVLVSGAGNVDVYKRQGCGLPVIPDTVRVF